MSHPFGGNANPWGWQSSVSEYLHKPRGFVPAPENERSQHCGAQACQPEGTVEGGQVRPVEGWVREVSTSASQGYRHRTLLLAASFFLYPREKRNSEFPIFQMSPLSWVYPCIMHFHYHRRPLKCQFNRLPLRDTLWTHLPKRRHSWGFWLKLRISLLKNKLIVEGLFKIVVKYTQQKCILLTTFGVHFCGSHRHPSPELFLLPQLNFCTHRKLSPNSSPPQ